jgi:hypothetical protein
LKREHRIDMAISPYDALALQARLTAWIALGNDGRDAALIANVLNAASSIGDVLTNLTGKQQFCPAPPGFHVKHIAGIKHKVDDHQNVTVLDFSLTADPNPGRTVVRIH